MQQLRDRFIAIAGANDDGTAPLQNLPYERPDGVVLVDDENAVPVARWHSHEVVRHALRRPDAIARS